MRIIISPAKQMRVETDSFSCSGLPPFMEKTEQMKDFNWSGYHYDEERSTENAYVFIRTAMSGAGA